jgi:hypothetical protein
MKRLIAIALLLAAAPLAAQTLSFRVESATSGGATITPRLTWSTNPIATSCTASGGAGWSGVKGPSGVVTLAPISQSETYTLSCSWPGTGGRVEVSWTPATHNDNGTPAPDDGDLYTDPKAVLIAYGTSATVMPGSAVFPHPETSGVITGLTAGTRYYFCGKSVSQSDRQSNCSTPPVERVASSIPGETITRTAGLVFVKPNPPSGLTFQ